MNRGEAVQRSVGCWTNSAVRVQTVCVRQGAGVHAGAAPRPRPQVRIQPIEWTRSITLIRSKSRAIHTTNFVIPDFPLDGPGFRLDRPSVRLAFYQLNKHLVHSLETEDLVACVDAALSKVVSVLEESTSLNPEHQHCKGRGI